MTSASTASALNWLQAPVSVGAAFSFSAAVAALAGVASSALASAVTWTADIPVGTALHLNRRC